MRVLLLPILFVLADAAAAQTTWYVDLNGTAPGTGTQADPFTSLQFAIAQPTTVSGDTILVLPSTYLEQIDFLGKDLVVRSTAGAGATILDAGGAGSVVTFSSGETAAAVLDGFTVQDGDTEDGHVPVDNPGGGIECDGASPTLVNLVVRSNNSLQGGGLRFKNGSTATLTDSVVRDNNPTISHGNVGSSRGGGMWSSCDSAPVITRVDFLGNDRAASGGGAYGSGTFVECLFDGNKGFQGAGLYVPDGCTTQVYDSVIRGGNTCIDSDCSAGGGVFGPAQLFDCTIEDNFAVQAGGGAYGATLTRCTLRANRVGFQVGAQGGGAAACTLIECVIEENRVNGLHPLINFGAGGGIAGSTATDCVIRNNSSLHARGGGAWNSTLTRCSVYGNSTDPGTSGAPTSGGGVANCQSTWTSIWGNTATTGAGVSNGTSVNCTIYGNVATSGMGGGVQAGVVNQAGNATLRNTIVRGNTGTELLATNGTVTATYSDVEGGHPGTGNFDADPAWWDAPSGDFHLMAGSPCIDTGDPLETDPDGSPRDVGAFPYDPTWAPGAKGYCYGDAASCPCGNGGSGDGGCDLPQATGGVALTVEDFLPNGAGGGTAKLVGAGYPPAAAPTVIAIRSLAAETPPVVFGDGLRCIGFAGFTRLSSTMASGGGSQLSIAHGAGAGTFYYQLWFRSTPASFCVPEAAFNLSNGLSIAWP